MSIAIGSAELELGDATAPGYPVALRDEVDRYLSELHFSGDSTTAGLEEAMRYSLLAGGKRVRPVLALATARALGLPHRAVLPLAAALELIHTFSLIHDDLPGMDDDDFRRGRPTNHRVFGEGVAILAGDALLAEAFRLVLVELEATPERRLDAAQALARATATDGLAGGQYVDLAGTAATEEAILRMHRLKTGALLEASVRSVVALARPAPRVAAGLEAYARELGLMFQIVDDLLDTGENTGKPRGSDARNGRRTLAVEGGSRRASRLADECLARIAERLSKLRCDTAELLSIATFVRRRDR